MQNLTKLSRILLTRAIRAAVASTDIAKIFKRRRISILARFEPLEPRTLLSSLTISGSFGTDLDTPVYALHLESEGIPSENTIAIDWGDNTGSIVHGTADDVQHTYTDVASHTIKAYAVEPLEVTGNEMLDDSDHSVVFADSLTIHNGATLDLNGHDLVVSGAELSTLETEILAGEGLTPAGGASDPDAPKIIDSANSDGLHIILPLDFDGLGADHWANTSVSGQDLFFIGSFYKGDITLDGVVNGSDDGTAASNLGQTTPGLSDFATAYLMGDINLNGAVDSTDLNILTSNSDLGTLTPADNFLVANAFGHPGDLIGSPPTLANSGTLDVSVTPIAPSESDITLFTTKVVPPTILTRFTPFSGTSMSTYRATINWGDGSAIESAVVQPDLTSGELDIVGSSNPFSPHHYVDFGTYTITVTLQRASDGGEIGVGTLSGSINQPPEVATNLRAGTVLQEGERGVLLTWDPVPDAINYYIYRSTTSQGEGGAPTGSVTSGETTYQDLGLSTGDYYYQVVASGSGFLSDPSLEVSASLKSEATLLAPPTDFTGAITGSALALTWTLPDDATGYVVQESLTGDSLDSADWSNISTGGVVGSVTISVAQKAYYRISALYSGGASSDFGIVISPIYSPQDDIVQVSASADESSGHVILNWTPNTAASYYAIYRRELGSTDWGTPTIVSGSTTDLMDESSTTNTAYEYRVDRYDPQDAVSATGYVDSAVDLAPVESQGTFILLIDNRLSTPLAAGIERLESDLEGDGWKVISHEIDPADSVEDVRNTIFTDYEADPTQEKSVFILGNVPVPHVYLSTSPDDHVDNLVWAADTFYGDMDGGSGDGLWSPSSESPGSFDDAVIPGNGADELSVGRVDMFDLPAFQQGGETDLDTAIRLTQQYLDKDHAFRTGFWIPQQKGLIQDNFNGTKGVASAGWSNFTALLGAGSIVVNQAGVDQWSSFMSGATTQTNPYLWAYGSGGGANTFDSASGIFTTTDLVTEENNAVFNMFFGSYFGNVDHSNDLLRAVLANAGSGLTATWGDRPADYFESMGIGGMIGDAMRTSTSLNIDSAVGTTHMDLLGDPTLTMNIVHPASDLVSKAASGGGVTLSWTASTDDIPDSNFVGYVVYSYDPTTGASTRISGGTPITSTTFTDATGDIGTDYMVRAEVLEGPSPASYYNLSEGVFALVYTPTSDSITITQTDTMLNVADGSTTATYPLGDVSSLTIAAGTSNETVTLDQSSYAISPGLIGLAGTGNIALIVEGGTMDFSADQGINAPNVTIQASNDANLTFGVAQNLAGLIADSGAALDINSNVNAGVMSGLGSLTIESGKTLKVSGDASLVAIDNNGTLDLDVAGSVAVSSSISGAGDLTKGGTGTVTFSGSYSATGNLAVSEGTLVFAETSATRGGSGVLLKFKSVTISSNAVLDVTNHDLMIGHASLLGVETEFLASFGLLPNGDTSDSTDPQLTSSSVMTSGNTFLVPVDADALLGDGTLGSAIGQTWDGVTITEPGTVLVKYTYFGDVTLDGQVDNSDFVTAASNYGRTTPGIANIEVSWLMGDVTLNGTVDNSDFTTMASEFGHGVGDPL